MPNMIPLQAFVDKRGVGVVIPTKSNEKRRRFDKEAYRQRACAEQCFGWLKEWRAVATRYDKYASTYRSTVELACIARYLKHLFSNKA